jgi:hypothetical protein
MRGLCAGMSHETPMILSEIPELSLLGSERKNTLFPVGQIVITFAEWLIRSIPSPGEQLYHFS